MELHTVRSEPGRLVLTPKQWIEQRLHAIDVRKLLTDEWKRADIKDTRQYATLTKKCLKTNVSKHFLLKVKLVYGNHITSKSISNKYKKYCKKLGIVRKSNYKARKTCLTKIADNPNINLKDAMQYGGHKDVKTYIKHYCFSRYSDEHQRKELEKCLNM